MEVPKVKVLAGVLPTLQPDRRSSSDGLNALTTAQVSAIQPQHETRVFLLRQTPALPPQLRAPLSREARNRLDLQLMQLLSTTLKTGSPAIA